MAKVQTNSPAKWVALSVFVPGVVSVDRSGAVLQLSSEQPRENASGNSQNGSRRPRSLRPNKTNGTPSKRS